MPSLMILRATRRLIGSRWSAIQTSPKAAFTDLLEQLVTADHRRRGWRGLDFASASLHGRSGQQTVVPKVFPEQLLHLVAQTGIPATGLVEIRRPRLGRIAIQSAKEDFPFRHNSMLSGVNTTPLPTGEIREQITPQTSRSRPRAARTGRERCQTPSLLTLTRTPTLSPSRSVFVRLSCLSDLSVLKYFCPRPHSTWRKCKSVGSV
jgi:hypothetical protein